MTVPAPRTPLPGAGAPLDPDEYLEFLDREYLDSYVGHGGAAVKLVVAGQDAAQPLADGLARIGTGFLHVAVDAAGTRIHMIDQVFTAVARQLDWTAMAGRVVRAAYDRAAFPVPEKDPATGDAPAGGAAEASPGPAELTVATVAAYHEVDQTELYRSVRRALEHLVLADTSLSHEFRVAMLRLCQERLGRGDVDAAERDAVLDWLRGEKVPAASLRKVGLYGRIARHNARPLLSSTSGWVRRAGYRGIVMQVDLERLAVARRPPAGMRDGIYYSKAATMDAYEVLRQLIDATDELQGLLVAVLMPPELITDEGRGLPAYTALQLRVADEVRDRRRPNPYATLIRIGTRLEAVR